MLSQKEKDHIIEKIKFENEIKSGITQKKKSNLLSLFNSKIGLLLIGSLLSGILFPWINYIKLKLSGKNYNLC